MPFDEYIKYAENERLRCREENSIEEDSNVEGLYFCHLPALVQLQKSLSANGRSG